MRTSILSRSVIAVATLAVGSAVFAAVPATAATQNGVTRQEVLTAAAALRADGATQIDPSASTETALLALARKVCGPTAQNPYASPVETPGSVDGLTVTSMVDLGTEDEGGFTPFDTCSFTAVATVGAGTTFSGESRVYTNSFNGIIGGGPIITAQAGPSYSDTIYQLSDDVFVSPPQTISNGLTFAGFDANGLVKSPTSKRVLTSVKIADKKSKAEKRAAKKAYVKRIKVIKKSYAKAKRKAGKSAEKKAIARMKYVTRRATTKSAYAYAVADYKLVNRRTNVADERRFSVTADNFFPLAL
jgi:hypothetical protein